MNAKKELLDYILNLTPEQVEKKEDFMHFLRFCAEHLNKGGTVQEVWRDYQESVARKSK